MKNCCIYKKFLVLAVASTAFIAFLTTCKNDTIQNIQKNLPHINQKATKLFGYSPSIEIVSTQDPCGKTITITAHGYGANKNTGYYIAQHAPLTGHVITFNFPDHDITKEADPHTLKFGTINELLPLVYILKMVVATGADAVNLYGFSAGGGAIVNVLALLNTNRFDEQLQRIGITQDDKADILQAVARGIVLLDAPLKSVDEIKDLRGTSDELELLAAQYKKNDLRPIDTVSKLAGLCLNIVLYFEYKDEIIYNRDDAEFISKLRMANACGVTRVVYGKNGGHVGNHKELWREYKKLTRL